MSSFYLLWFCFIGLSLCELMAGPRYKDSPSPLSPYVSPRIPAKYGTIRQTSTILTRDEANEQLHNKQKKTIISFHELLKNKHYYKTFIQQNENIFNIPHHNIDKHLSYRTLVSLKKSFVLLYSECFDPATNQTVYFMATGIAISKNIIITASHNIDCKYIDSSYEFNKIYSYTDVTDLQVLYDGIPHIDDIVILKSEANDMIYPEFTVNKKIKSLNSVYYRKNIKTPIVCVGYVGNTQSVYLKDGKTLNRTELDEIYGSSGELIVSFGLIESFDDLLNQTCDSMVSQMSDLKHEQCRNLFFNSNSNVFHNTSLYNFVHSANIIEGMSGGICIDPYHPLSVIGVNSYGAHTQHGYSVSNFATLLSHSSAYQKYSSWWWYFVQMMKGIWKKLKTEL